MNFCYQKPGTGSGSGFTKKPGSGFGLGESGPETLAHEEYTLHWIPHSRKSIERKVPSLGLRKNDDLKLLKFPLKTS